MLSLLFLGTIEAASKAAAAANKPPVSETAAAHGTGDNQQTTQTFTDSQAMAVFDKYRARLPQTSEAADALVAATKRYYLTMSRLKAEVNETRAQSTAQAETHNTATRELERRLTEANGEIERLRGALEAANPTHQGPLDPLPGAGGGGNVDGEPGQQGPTLPVSGAVTPVAPAVQAAPLEQLPG